MANPVFQIKKSEFEGGYCGCCGKTVAASDVEWISDKGGDTPACPVCKADMIYTKLADAQECSEHVGMEVSTAMRHGEDVVITAYNLENGKLRVVIANRRGDIVVKEGSYRM